MQDPKYNCIHIHEKNSELEMTSPEILNDKEIEIQLNVIPVWKYFWRWKEKNWKENERFKDGNYKRNKHPERIKKSNPRILNPSSGIPLYPMDPVQLKSQESTKRRCHDLTNTQIHFPMAPKIKSINLTFNLLRNTAHGINPFIPVP